MWPWKEVTGGDEKVIQGPPPPPSQPPANSKGPRGQQKHEGP